MRRSAMRAFATMAVLVVAAAACVPTPPDPSDDPWGDGCNDSREHFKETGENSDRRGEWWYHGGTGANGSVELTNEFGAPEGFGCHVAKLSTGAPGTDPQDNEVRVLSPSKFNDGRLAEVTAFRYSTYRSSSSTPADRVTAAMSVGIISFFAEDFAATLHYEPHRQSGATITDDVWQTWDPNVGRWWTDEEGPANLYSLLDLKLKYPDAVIGVFGISVPPGHPNQVIGVDGIRFDDMRTNMGATVPDQPLGGWPVQPPPTSDNRAVAAGSSFTCALKTGGGVSCWGENHYGQLGDGTHSDRRSGVPVVGIDDAVAVTAGSDHACALSEGGGVSCWGENHNGQLGDGTTGGDRAAPVAVVGLSAGVTQIDAEGDVTCAALADGTARCWGANTRGELGNGAAGTGVHSNVPVQVSGLASVAEVAAGSCARTTGGQVYCWGAGSLGRIGDGTGADSSVPVLVTGLGDAATSITTSMRVSCAGTASGAKCWGRSSFMGVDSGVPVPIADIAGPVTSLDANGLTACAINGDSGAMCWGVDGEGQLGNGEPLDPSAAAVPVTGLPTGVDSLSVGGQHACAVADGFVRCWGSNLYGQSGHDEGQSSSVPVLASA
jgi:hypothetical protein